MSSAQTRFLFLFDIDGTLLRAGTQTHREAFAEAFRDIYGHDLTLDGISAAGRTDAWLLAETLLRAGLPPETIERDKLRAFRVMEDYVDAHLTDLRDRVLPGVTAALDALRGLDHTLGLLTGNLSRIAAAKMRHAGLDGYFKVGAYGEESAVRADLVPIALLRARELKGHAVEFSTTCVIGDTPLDVEAGRLTGTRTVGVATGPCSVEELQEAQPDLVLTSLDGPSVVADLTSVFT